MKMLKCSSGSITRNRPSESPSELCVPLTDTWIGKIPCPPRFDMDNVVVVRRILGGSPRPDGPSGRIENHDPGFRRVAPAGLRREPFYLDPGRRARSRKSRKPYSWSSYVFEVRTQFASKWAGFRGVHF